MLCLCEAARRKRDTESRRCFLFLKDMDFLVILSEREREREREILGSLFVFLLTVLRIVNQKYV